jgi:hypothetical protein
MPALNGAIKVFIVERLACFERPVDVQKAVKQTFKVDVKLEQLMAYDPKNVAGQRLSKTLKDVFEATRKEFLKNTAAIPIAHKAYRLRLLDRLADRMVDNGNVAMAAQLLEQAAKEQGEAYSNKYKHEHTGKDGGPMEIRNLTDAELDKRIAELQGAHAQRAQP